MRAFYYLLANTTVAGIVNFTVWFAIIFYIYLQTQSVLATSIISGLYLVSVALSGFWFGSLIDNYKKKLIMLASSAFSLVTYAIGFVLYITASPEDFSTISSPKVWVLVVLLLSGVIAGNIRGIALPTLVTIMVPEKIRDKANGLVGSAMGLSFLITSVISGLLVGHSGMYWVLLLAIGVTVLVIGHLLTISIPENKVVSLAEGAEAAPKKVDIRGTIKVINKIPGLFALILFTTFNNFLGGVFMSLMDAYGLSMVSVQVWGLLWGFLSTGFIIGGLIIAKFGLGKNPLRAMFLANIVIWVVSSVFTIQPSIILLTVGSYIYLCMFPYIEAAEHTIIQKVVPPERQGRVFGFAQSIEQAASPLMAFAIGPIAQFVFIPFMTTGAGVDLIGSWYGTGPDRGIALVFTVAGVIGLVVTILAMQTKYYRMLSARYVRK